MLHVAAEVKIRRRLVAAAGSAVETLGIPADPAKGVLAVERTD